MGSYSYGGRSRYPYDATVARIERSLASEGLEITIAVDQTVDAASRLRTGVGFYTLLGAIARTSDDDGIMYCVVSITEEAEGVFVEVRVPEQSERDGMMHIVPISEGIGARLRHAIAPLLAHRSTRRF